MGKMDEQVIVFPTEMLFKGKIEAENDLYFQGFEPFAQNGHRFHENMDNCMMVMTRGECEHDPAYKQPIPYCVITKNGQVFVTKRFDTQTEARLHNRSSIGVGGHVNPSEHAKDAISAINFSLYRELREEVLIDRVPWKGEASSPKLVGFINDDADSVGRVHFAMVYHLDLKPWENIEVHETDMMSGKWLTIPDATEDTKMESWSRILLDQYFKDDEIVPAHPYDLMEERRWLR